MSDLLLVLKATWLVFIHMVIPAAIGAAALELLDRRSAKR